MKTTFALAALLSSFVTPLGGQAIQPQFRVVVIPADRLPQHFTARTFSYRFSEANAESLLAVLMKSRIPVRQAWLPLDNMCMGPVGPRFTIELSRKDKRVTRFGFVKGSGRLRCSPRLKWYTISK